MTTIFILAAIAIYLLFYFTYGRFLSKKVIKSDPSQAVPSEQLNDGVDYVPTKKFVLFGHHFASIAGVGPIVGPAIALAYGWLPGFLWLWVGNIFIGAVQDFFSLSVSVRYDGKSIQHVSQKLLSKFCGNSFAWFFLFLCILVVAAFGSVVSGLFASNAGAATSFLFMTVAALILGVLLYKTKIPFWISTLLGIGMLIASTLLGAAFPFLKLSNNIWLLIFFVYIIVAASLPVTVLLQPRDYLNSFLLYFGLIIGGVAAIIAFKPFSAPAFTSFSPVIFGTAKTPFWPAIPLIVACGALSGFHALVASGTSSKQLASEKDSLFVGYGAMFTEGVLATLVIISIAAFGVTALTKTAPALANKLKDAASWGNNYSSVISKTTGIGPAKMFIISFSEMISSVLPFTFTFIKTISAMWIASFAMTTLDTTNRLARYIVSELAEPIKNFSKSLHNTITNRWVASIIPAALGIGLAWTSGWKILWPAFSAANQLIASVAMITVSAWIYKQLNKKHLGITLIPGIILWITVTAGIIWYMTAIVPGSIQKNPFSGYIISVIMIIMFVINMILLSSFFKNFRKNSIA